MSLRHCCRADGQHDLSVLAQDLTLKRHARLKCCRLKSWRRSGNLLAHTLHRPSPTVPEHKDRNIRFACAGENLAEGYAEWQDVVNAWTAEGAQYDYSNPGYSGSTGHFTCVRSVLPIFFALELKFPSLHTGV